MTAYEMRISDWSSDVCSSDLGGIKALGGAKIKLLVVDTGDSVEKARRAAQRLLASEPDLTGATGSFVSLFTLAVTEMTERAELPFLTLSYSDQINERGFKYVFQTSPSAKVQAEATLPIAMKLATENGGKRPKTVGIIMDNTASPRSEEHTSELQPLMRTP